LSQGSADISPRLYHRLQRLGRLLAALCVAWFVAVTVLMSAELTPEDLQNHRAPSIRTRVHACDGGFRQRFDCAQTILDRGEDDGAGVVLLRLATASILPAIALGMWSVILRHARHLTRGPPPRSRRRALPPRVGA
jgi:hypothetical protein